MLYIVATPIGNLGDITLRALRVLKEVDLIACEDTRRTRKLLSHYGFKKPLLSYHAHNQKTRGPELIARLKRGENIALVSDAGTPGFSDPGADLVAAAWEAGIQVQAVPGPAAGVAALSMSGFKGDVTFVGFLPRRAGKRRDMLKQLANEPRVLIFYEAPGRLAETLADFASAMPDRQMLVVRELTKLYEECWRGPVTDVTERLAGQDLKGECTLILSLSADRDKEQVDVAGELLKTARETRLTGRRLAETVAARLKLPRRRVYQAYLELKGQNRLP